MLYQERGISFWIFAIAGAMLVIVLNISQEAMQSRWNVSVYYRLSAAMVWVHF